MKILKEFLLKGNNKRYVIYGASALGILLVVGGAIMFSQGTVFKGNLSGIPNLPANFGNVSEPLVVPGETPQIPVGSGENESPLQQSGVIVGSVPQVVGNELIPVSPLNKPTITGCSVNPSSVDSGGNVTFSATASSDALAWVKGGHTFSYKWIAPGLAGSGNLNKTGISEEDISQGSISDNFTNITSGAPVSMEYYYDNDTAAAGPVSCGTINVPAAVPAPVVASCGPRPINPDPDADYNYNPFTISPSSAPVSIYWEVKALNVGSDMKVNFHGLGGTGASSGSASPENGDPSLYVVNTTSKYDSSFAGKTFTPIVTVTSGGKTSAPFTCGGLAVEAAAPPAQVNTIPKLTSCTAEVVGGDGKALSSGGAVSPATLKYDLRWTGGNMGKQYIPLWNKSVKSGDNVSFVTGYPETIQGDPVTDTEGGVTYNDLVRATTDYPTVLTSMSVKLQNGSQFSNDILCTFKPSASTWLEVSTPQQSSVSQLNLITSCSADSTSAVVGNTVNWKLNISNNSKTSAAKLYGVWYGEGVGGKVSTFSLNPGGSGSDFKSVSYLSTTPSPKTAYVVLTAVDANGVALAGVNQVTVNCSNSVTVKSYTPPVEYKYAPKISFSNISLPNSNSKSFDPNKKEEVHIYFTLNTDANLTVDAYRVDSLKGLVKVASIVPLTSVGGGYKLDACWDGIGDDNKIAPEGTYTVKINVSNTAGSDSYTINNAFGISYGAVSTIKTPVVTQTTTTVPKTTTTSVASGFPDVKTISYSAAVKSVYDAGLMKGYPDGTFRPDLNINRAEIAKILALAFDKMPTASTYMAKGFSDVAANDWFYSYVLVLNQVGSIKGYNDGTYKPANSVTRAEFIKIAVSLTEVDLSKYKNASSFNDVPVSAWFAPYVAAAKDMGLVSGSNGYFFPNAYLTRGDAAVILNKLMAAGKI